MIEVHDYYPFGLLMPGRSTNVGYGHALYKFTGKERDREAGIGLDYFGARYYDPEIGRWLGVDPLAETYPGLNPYNYTLNNPVNLYDPQGTSVEAVQDANGTIIVTAGSYFADNDPTLYVYDVEGNRVAAYDLTDIDNLDILQRLDEIARGMGLEGEKIAGALYLNPEPMGQLALSAAWFAVGGSVMGPGMSFLGRSGASLTEAHQLLSWYRVAMTSRNLTPLQSFYRATGMPISAGAYQTYQRLLPQLNQMMRATNAYLSNKQNVDSFVNALLLIGTLPEANKWGLRGSILQYIIMKLTVDKE